MTDLAATARAAAMQLEVKKDAVRQVQSGDWRLTFTVAATDMPVALITAPPGTRYVLAVVEIDDNEQPVLSGPSPASPQAAAPTPEPQTPAKETDSRRSTSQDRVVQRCAILCGEERFQRWLGRHRWARYRTPDETPEEWAAEMVRMLCKVNSRRDLAIDNDARRRWDTLLLEYEQATGLAAADYRRSA